MKVFIISLICFVRFSLLFSLCPMIFDYDAAGNRIKRYTLSCLDGGSENRNQPNAATNQGGVSISPNPSIGEMTIIGSDLQPTMLVRFLNSEGRLIYERSLDDGIFDATNWPVGLYLVQILDKDKPRILRFIKSRQ